MFSIIQTLTCFSCFQFLNAQSAKMSSPTFMRSRDSPRSVLISAMWLVTRLGNSTLLPPRRSHVSSAGSPALSLVPRHSSLTMNPCQRRSRLLPYARRTWSTRSTGPMFSSRKFYPPMLMEVPARTLPAQAIPDHVNIASLTLTMLTSLEKSTAELLFSLAIRLCTLTKTF